jgi:hypothetical protein
MFKWDELEELKQGALQRDDYIEYLLMYQSSSYERLNLLAGS